MISSTRRAAALLIATFLLGAAVGAGALAYASRTPAPPPGRSATGTGWGATGVAIAYLLSTLVRLLTPVPSQVPIGAVILSLGISTAVGLFTVVVSD